MSSTLSLYRAMAKPETSAVVFDYFGTLASANGVSVWWAELPRRVAAAGGVLSDDLIRWFSSLPEEHAEHSTDELSYRVWTNGRLARLLRSSGLSARTRRQLLADTLEERYSRTFSIFPEVLAVLTELRSRGIRVGVCSNWDWALDKELRANGVAELVEFVVCSARVGFRKPHPGIFDCVRAASGVSPASVVFVGDEWSADISGSRRAGFRPAHVNRAPLCPIEDHDDVPCLPDLTGIIAMVDGASP